jgi:regulatory protein
MNLLARREHGQTELFRKLRLRGFSDAEIQQTLTQLAKENLQNDTRFAENYVHYRRNKGFGPVRIQGELLEKGLAEELIEHHLNMSDNAWFAEARRAWQKRFKNRLPTDYKSRTQQMRFLYQRGFTTEQIQSVIADE